MADPTKEWGTCTYCGDAFPPAGRMCPTCGNTQSIGPGRSGPLPKRQRYRLRLVQGFRMFLVVGAIVGLSYLMLSAAWSGPASVADPLTTAGTWTIGPGNFTALSGAVTGDDYVIGNYTVTSPLGAPITLLIFNDTEFAQFAQGQSASPLYNVTGDSASQLVFSAPYTDTFHFVWLNEYAPTTQLVLQVYVVTNYESNALVE